MNVFDLPAFTDSNRPEEPLLCDSSILIIYMQNNLNQNSEAHDNSTNESIERRNDRDT